MRQRAEIENRRVVARRLFDALCTQHPDKYIDKYIGRRRTAWLPALSGSARSYRSAMPRTDQKLGCESNIGIISCSASRSAAPIRFSRWRYSCSTRPTRRKATYSPRLEFHWRFYQRFMGSMKERRANVTNTIRFALIKASNRTFTAASLLSGKAPSHNRTDSPIVV
jgi:hypothetical protein